MNSNKNGLKRGIKHKMQKIFGFGIGGTGIVAVLIIAGIFLTKLDVAPNTGNVAIGGGVIIGLILGALGIFGVLKRLVR